MEGFKNFWSNVRLATCRICQMCWKGIKAAGVWTGKQFARFGRFCAKMWREHWGGPVLKALCPHGLVAILFVAVSAALLFYAFVIPDANPVVSYAGYAFSAYTLAVVCIRIPRMFGGVKKSLYSNKYSNRFLTDRKLRTEFFLYLSCGISTFYAVFKFCAGVYYRSIWLGALAVYYLIICFMRFGLMKRYRHNLQYEDEREQRLFGLKSYRFCGILMFVLNSAITGLVVQLIWKGETYRYPGVLIYVFATYAFYCVGMAVRNMAKHRKLETPILAATKMLSFACALMSILALQTAMLTQFGDGQEAFARLMNALTGTAVCLLIFGLAVWMVRRASREIKRMDEV